MSAEFYCSECKKPCRPGEVDFGIGPYEYWGAKGVDVRKAFVSDCCEADVCLDAECTKFYTLADVRADRESERADNYDPADKWDRP